MLWRIAAWWRGPLDVDATLAQFMAAAPPGDGHKLAHMPPLYERSHVAAFQALAHGTAEPQQQKIAMAYLLGTLCRVQDISYRPDSDRETVFAEGRRFVGQQIMKLFQLNTGNIENG